MANTSARSDVYVGAAGSNSGARGGIFRRTVGNGGWSALTEGLPEASHIQAITVHPTNPDIVYLGTRSGPYRSTNRGERWARLPFPDGTEVWSIMVHPKNPRILYAGTSPVGVYRSDDGGDSWRKLPKATQPQRVRMGLFQSADRGSSWKSMEIGRFSPLTYGRDVVVSPHDPRELFACLSPAARSKDGSLYRSQDLGQSWTRFDHGIKAGSTMMAVALHPRDREQVYCVSRQGQVFGTQDGGR